MDEVGKAMEEEAERAAENELVAEEADGTPVGKAVFKLEGEGSKSDSRLDAEGAEDGPPTRGRDNPKRPASVDVVCGGFW